MSVISLSDYERKILYCIVKSELERLSEVYNVCIDYYSGAVHRSVPEKLNLKIISLSKVLFKLHNTSEII